MYHIFSTIHSKYQGETMFCFACVATVFGYILGVNRVIDAIISKHSHETREKVVKIANKYTQTNFGEIAELLASNHLILKLENQNNVSSIDEIHDLSSRQDETPDETKIEGQEKQLQEGQEKQLQEGQEKQLQENAIVSPASHSTPEEDYELVRKNENVNHSRHKISANYFDWLNIF